MNNDSYNRNRKLQYHLLFICFWLTTINVCLACTNKKNDNNTIVSSVINSNDNESLISETASVDIPLAINVIRTSHTPDVSDLYCYDDIMSFKEVGKFSQEIVIDATSIYYDQYISGDLFYAPTLESYPMNYRECLNIAIDIVNNTNERLDIEELDFNVEKSSIDNIPYIFIYTSDLFCDMICFSNESDFNWKSFSFYYTLLKKDEEFDGQYKKSCQINFFEHTKTIDLLNDLIEMGFDYNKLIRQINDSDDSGFYSENGEREICLYAYEKEDSIKYAESFFPFDFRKRQEYKEDGLKYPYRGYAKLYGKIVFDSTIYDKEISFCTDIVLSAPCGGAGADENDHYDVKLKSNGENYMLRYPYTTVIEPYGSEMVSLSLKADKSSNHKFYISVKNGNNLEIRSKDVKLHYLAPKHYYPNNP